MPRRPVFCLAALVAACAAGTVGADSTRDATPGGATAQQAEGAEPKASGPWTLDRALDTPSWLHLEFAQRTRYAYLWNQFRPQVPGDDRALSLRTRLLAEFRFPRIAGAVELLDSRVYLEDGNTPLSNGLVNPVALLQAWVRGTFPDAGTAGATLEVTAGRQTLDLGSRRLVARNRFRNTINTFTGVHVRWDGPAKDAARAFVVVPVLRRPSVFDAATGNEIRSDTELTRTLFGGLYWRSRPFRGQHRAEVYVLGLDEEDDPGENHPTRDRRLATPGFRLWRPGAPGQVDFAVEAAVQAGTSRATPLPGDVTDLDTLATFFHGALGYTFRQGWRPRLAVLFDWASGDRDPDDDTFERFDTLFGARRFDYGPTGLWGAYARSNILAPALRFEFRPSDRLSGSVTYRPAWLASARDAWTTTLIRDPDGASGRFIGHQVDGRMRYWILPGNLAIAGGFAWLRLGEFPENAPNGIPDAADPAYAYLQWMFRI